MSTATSAISNIPNRLLAALPEEAYERLLPHLQPLSLRQREILYKPGQSIEYVYFPNNSIISLVIESKEGRSVEVGLIGNEGMAGLPIVQSGNSPSLAIVQVAGEGTRLPAAVLKVEFDRGGALYNLLLGYALTVYIEVSQLAACNRLHAMDKRLARWLLMVADRVDIKEFALKQESIAQMLGTLRSEVSLAAGLLKQQRLIEYSRGKITILDRSGLAAMACECYKIMKQDINQDAVKV